jgi:hypothetical protein
MSQWTAQQAERDWDRRATAFVAALMTEPDPAMVGNLAAAADGDLDHARWELRYLRRAVGLLVAGRDALDDRTASLVGKALARAVEHDPSSAPTMRAISATQFNARLRVYRDLVGQRGSARTPVGRLAEALLGFAGGPAGGEVPAWATAWVTAETDRCNEALRHEFGAADLPEDIAPSAIPAPRR